MVIVTGGAGFIGSAIIAGFNDQALAIDRVPAKGGRSMVVNLTDPASVRDCIAKLQGETVTHVVHLAAITPFSGNTSPDYSLDLRMAEAVTTICNDLQVSQLLYMSGWVVYDPAAAVPITEDAALKPDTDYGKSKLAVERYFMDHLKGTKMVAMRAASAYGPGQVSAGLIPNLVATALNDGMVMVNALTTKRDYLFINDLVAAVVALTKTSFAEHTPINLGSGQSVSVKEVADAIVAACAAQGKQVTLQVSPQLNESPAADNQLAIARAQSYGILTQLTPFSDGIIEYITWKQRN